MEIRFTRISSLEDEAAQSLMGRAQHSSNAQLEETVQRIVEAVRTGGDSALVGFAKEFDGIEMDPSELRVTEAEFETALNRIDATTKQALDRAVTNIRKHHEALLPKGDLLLEVAPGVLTGERYRPIESVGLYVPQGKGRFPSVMVMLGVPASLAGVPDITVCSPPGPDGTIDDATLYVAHLCGLKNVFKTGGAQAVAALAFGTDTIPKVGRILGPGNQYVTKAKQLVYGEVDPGTPAGPSELIVLTDETADPKTAAIELLVEAEHGSDSASLLVTNSEEVAKKVSELLPDLVNELPEPRRKFCTDVLAGFGGIVVTTDSVLAVDFVNAWAPEHLRILTKDPWSYMDRIDNAGELLLGESSSVAFGNYVAGVNAIIPTGQMAKFHSNVGVEDFLKRSSFVHVSEQAAEDLWADTSHLADYEGFPSHSRAARWAGTRSTS